LNRNSVVSEQTSFLFPWDEDLPDFEKIEDLKKNLKQEKRGKVSMKDCRILVINVGSTSTKIGYFIGDEPKVNEAIVYTGAELAEYLSLSDQLPRRKDDLLSFLLRRSLDLKAVDIIVSRGGPGKPGPAGAYEINDAMCGDLLAGKYGEHPSSLGPAIARELTSELNIPAIVIDPPSTDEFQDLARFSGLPEIERTSAFHALNQKSAARRAARDLGMKYEDINVVVAHLGGGITIGAHQQGKVIDCTNGLTEGPFTPERAGSLPTFDLVDLVLSGSSDKEKLKKKLVGQGGLSAYLGTSDAEMVEARIKEGDAYAERIFKAMAYQVVKDIGAMSAVLKGNVQGIVLTGGLAKSELLTRWIAEWINSLAPVFFYPGEDEMKALAEGAIQVLEGGLAVKRYEP
jgi:butyrate kinase